MNNSNLDVAQQDSQKEQGGDKLGQAVSMPLPSPVRITDTQSQLLVAPQPLRIEIDSPPDLVAVLITPLALAIAAGYFTVRTNRQQIRSSAANFRHTWQLDLRNALVSYIGTVHQLNVKGAVDARFPLSDAAEGLRTQLMSSQATIVLMLDTQKQYAQDLKSAMAETGNAVFSTPPDAAATLAGLGKVVTAAQVALETAWQDIRRDLHHDATERS